MNERRLESKFDDRGKIYQRLTYEVDPNTGTVGNVLTENIWYDASENIIKQLPSGSNLFTKSVFNSLGKETTSYVGYDLDETTYAEATNVDGDTIFSQTETTFDDAQNSIQSTTRQRYNNAPASQTGPLKDPSTTPKARVSYAARSVKKVERG